MAVKTEANNISDVLKEEPGSYGVARAVKTAKSGETLNIGSIVQDELVDVDEIQTNTGWSGTGTAGTYTITFWDSIDNEFKTTADIADAASNATISAALVLAASGGDSGIVSGGTIESTSWTLTYSGARYAGIDVPLATVDVSSWTGVSAAVFTETTKGSITSVKVILITDENKPSGICLENLGTLTADVEALFLVRGPSVVNEDQLGYNSLTKAVVNLALEKLGIIVRSEPAISEFQTT